jgi:hypothetical protein
VHNWASHGCLVAGSLVRMASGREMPIADIVVGDEVWTPAGAARVLNAGAVKVATDLLEITCADGSVLRCTPEHKILTGRGFVTADALRGLDVVYSGWEWPCVLSTLISTVTGSGFRAVITGETAGVSLDQATYTEPCGSTVRGLYLSGMMSTTGTAIPSTMLSPIWNSFQSPSIFRSTPDNALRPGSSTLQAEMPLQKQQSGIAPKLVGNGIPSMGRGHGSGASGISALVRSAVSRFARLFLRGPSSATRVVRIKRVLASDGQGVLVYDLTVEKHGCYQASGLLVSNSDALRGMAVRHKVPEMRDQETRERVRLPQDWAWS